MLPEHLRTTSLLDLMLPRNGRDPTASLRAAIDAIKGSPASIQASHDSSPASVRKQSATMPPPFGSPSEAARLLISHVTSVNMLAGYSNTVAHDLTKLRSSFPPERQLHVGAQFAIGSQWDTIYRPDAPTIVAFEPYGLAGTSYVALAAARLAESSPKTPNFVMVTPHPSLFAYDTHGRAVINGGIIVDQDAAIHVGLFPYPITCSTVVAGCAVAEFAEEFSRQAVKVVGTQRALACGQSKFRAKERLHCAGATVPSATLITSSDPSLIKQAISSFVEKHPNHRGLVVKPDNEAHGTGVTIFHKGASLAAVGRCVRETVQRFGTALLEERIPSFSLDYPAKRDCNFRILRAPGEKRWIGIEIRSGENGSAVNLHRGAKALRFTPDSLAHLTNLSGERLTATFKRLERALDQASQRVADAIGGDLVAIDVIVDRNFRPYVNEAVTTIGGGIGTLATLPGSLDERLAPAHAMFSSLVRRSGRHPCPRPEYPLRSSKVAAESLLSGTYCGHLLLGSPSIEHPALFALALHHCSSACDSAARLISRDMHYQLIVSALTKHSLDSHLIQIVHDLGPNIEAMPLTLVALAEYAYAQRDKENARGIAEALRETWPPDSQYGSAISTLIASLGLRDYGYRAESLRHTAHTLQAGALRTVQLSLGILTAKTPNTVRQELLTRQQQPSELIEEARYWKAEGKYRLAFELLVRAMDQTLQATKPYLYQSTILNTIGEELYQLRSFFPPRSTFYARASTIGSLLRISEKPDAADGEARPPSAADWLIRRCKASITRWAYKRALRSLLKESWEPQSDKAERSLVSLFMTLSQTIERR